MQPWRHGGSKHRDYHVPGEALAMMGAKLAALVCKHMRAVFRTRRRVLKNNVEYSERRRDPPPNADETSGGNAAGNDDED